ncbi:MAG: hypothetical protein GY874_20885 [Desulfobacteraceae bacterium]|nr:hypothetical protein [Desulfobacteraceae bacterium]
MNSNKAELIAGIAGAGSFLGTLILIGWPIWLCLVNTLVIYLGVKFVLRRAYRTRVRKITSGTAAGLAQLTEQIRLQRRQLNKLRRLAPSVPNTPIRQLVLNICSLSDKIFRNFKEDPDDIRRAHRFLSQFQKVMPIIQDYTHLASDKDRCGVLTTEDEGSIEMTLKSFESNLKDVYQGFQQNNLQKLRMDTGTLKRMLHMDRTIHRKKSD